jgi:hypothetical protein
VGNSSGDETGSDSMKDWEIIADNLSKAGFTLGCVSMINSSGQTIFVADAHRDDGKRFIVHADDKLTAFAELERQALTVTFYLESIRSVR